ncbi:GDP-mannose 4,6-dehydratase [Fusobacterium sp. PH5-44]|uniref:GDP-mannose 4,6-dehydratase n=1 Tax=unclassified Fusobacterium TaxID=2648384 RepID=UPI003D2582B2
MKILITGGAGFIGSHLVESLLNLGHNIIVVDNFDDFYDINVKCRNVLDSLSKKHDLNKIIKEADKEVKINLLIDATESKNYKLYYEDIRNNEKMDEIFYRENPEMIINLAALAGVGPSLERALEYESVNVHGMMILLELCKKYKIIKFIQASSSSVYGNNEKVPFKETDIVDKPISPYAATKKSGEIIGYQYHYLCNINMILLRFFTVYGERQRPDLAIHKFTKLIFEDKEIPFYGTGESSRDYTYIGDIIDGIISSVNYLNNNENVYEIFNLGNFRTINLRNMVEIIEKNIGKKAKIKYLDSKPGDVNITFADIKKAREILEYNPKIAFETGIKKFIKWYYKNSDIYKI